MGKIFFTCITGLAGIFFTQYYIMNGNSTKEQFKQKNIKLNLSVIYRQ